MTEPKPCPSHYPACEACRNYVLGYRNAHIVAELRRRSEGKIGPDALDLLADDIEAGKV